MVHYAHQRALSNSNARASGSERKNDEKRKPHVIGFVLGVDLNLTIKISFDMISIKRKKEKDFLFFNKQSLFSSLYELLSSSKNFFKELLIIYSPVMTKNELRL